jgi:hypothetical protein
MIVNTFTNTGSTTTYGTTIWLRFYSPLIVPIFITSYSSGSLLCWTSFWLYHNSYLRQHYSSHYSRIIVSFSLCYLLGIRRYEQSLTHHTPDCAQYICMVCKVSQPGHFPANCPQRSPSVYHDTLDWRVFNCMKGIMLWSVSVSRVVHMFLFFFFFFSFLGVLRIHARYAWTIVSSTHVRHMLVAQTIAVFYKY